LKSVADLTQAVAAGLLTVLLLAASNADRGVRIEDLGPPIVLALLVAACCWLIARLVVRHGSVRGPLATLLVLALLMYGYVSAPIESLLPFNSTNSSLVVFALFTIAVVWLLTRAGRIRPLGPDLSRGFSVALATMLTVATIAAARGFVGEVESKSPGEAPEVNSIPQSEVSDGPDIFLIVLDAYTRSDYLREIYGYDNSGFEAELARRGFQIPGRAIANYGATFLAMASLMNWDYVDVLEPRLLETGAERTAVYELVEDNRTVRFLKGIGYEFVYLRSSYPAMASNRLADLELPERVRGQFGQLFASRTIALPLIRAYCLLSRCSESKWPFTPEGPAVLEEKFRYLGELAKHDSPRFVLAHFLLPHEPFRLDSTCAPIEPLWPSTFDAEEEAEVRRLYPQQVACTNRRVLASVDSILAAADRDPIILIQADHGYGRLPWGRTGPLEETDSDRVRERMAVFAAYRLPGPEAPEVPTDISPVNVFRLLLSNYFDKWDLEPIDDVSWWSAWERPYEFTRLEWNAGD
jgi:hypothetical protein